MAPTSGHTSHCHRGLCGGFELYTSCVISRSDPLAPVPYTIGNTAFPIREAKKQGLMSLSVYSLACAVLALMLACTVRAYSLDPRKG